MNGRGRAVKSSEGEPRLPLMWLYASIIVLPACACCFVAGTPKPGANSERIALIADVAMIFRSNLNAAALRQFYCSESGCGHAPIDNASSKESVSCVSALLSLFCRSRYVSFLL